MALRDWPVRRIGFLWIGGILFYVGLAVLGQIRRQQWEERTRQEFGPLPDLSIGPDTLPTAKRDSLAGLMFALLRETNRGTPAHRDSVLQQLHAVVRDTPLTAARRDSLYRALNVPPRLTASQRDSLQSSAESLFAPVLAPIAEGIGKSMSGMGPWLVIGAILVLAPGIALVTLTVVWAYSRRLRTLGSGAAAA
jgi:hypothetical protein